MADITTKSVVSEYSSELALACRTNPDGSMPFNKNFILEFENADGSTEERTVIGGIYGKLGAVDISGINGGNRNIFILSSLIKKIKLQLTFQVYNPPATAALDIATALNADLTTLQNFTNIGHGFHAKVLKEKYFLCQIFLLKVTNIPTFDAGLFYSLMHLLL